MLPPLGLQQKLARPVPVATVPKLLKPPFAPAPALTAPPLRFTVPAAVFTRLAPLARYRYAVPDTCPLLSPARSSVPLLVNTFPAPSSVRLVAVPLHNVGLTLLEPVRFTEPVPLIFAIAGLPATFREAIVSGAALLNVPPVIDRVVILLALFRVRVLLLIERVCVPDMLMLFTVAFTSSVTV